MVEVEVALDVAAAGRLPPICVMSGEPADGAVPLRVDRSLRRWTAPTIRVPMSKSAFRKWSFHQQLMIRARIAAMLLVGAALIFSAKNALVALLALALAGGSMAVSVRAEKRLISLQPGIDRSRDSVNLSGVHPDFAAAVRESRSGPA